MLRVRIPLSPDDEEACRATAAASCIGGILAGLREFWGLGCRAVGSKIRTGTWPVIFRQPVMAGTTFFVINHKENIVDKKLSAKSTGGLMLKCEGKKLM